MISEMVQYAKLFRLRYYQKLDGGEKIKLTNEKRKIQDEIKSLKYKKGKLSVEVIKKLMKKFEYGKKFKYTQGKVGQDQVP